jgi:endoglucanase
MKSSLVRFSVIVVLAAFPFHAGCGAVAQDWEDEPGTEPATLVKEQSPTKNTPPIGACSAASVMISDGEHSPNQTNLAEGRGGYWYTYADTNGTTITPTSGSHGGSFEMTPPGANGTARAARMAGAVGSAEIVYAGMGLNFVDPKGAYDARRYEGIAFYAKKGSADATSRVRVKVPDRSTDPDGRVCQQCFNDFGASIELTTDWQLFAFPFDRLTQEPGWGDPRPRSIDPEALFGIQFQVLEPGQRFDVWVDELAFIGCR